MKSSSKMVSGAAFADFSRRAFRRLKRVNEPAKTEIVISFRIGFHSANEGWIAIRSVHDRSEIGGEDRYVSTAVFSLS